MVYRRHIRRALAERQSRHNRGVCRPAARVAGPQLSPGDHMITTAQIIDKLGPCEEGRAFAEEHPDPREALEAALADEPGDEPGEGTLWSTEDVQGWHFVRWACECLLGVQVWQETCRQAAPVGPDEDWTSANYRQHAVLCAERLREWLDAHYPI